MGLAVLGTCSLRFVKRYDSPSNLPPLDGEVLAYLEAAGLPSVVIHSAISGAQSVCYVIGEPQGPPTFVLKRFVRKKAFHSAAAASIEYEALRLLHQALSKREGLRAPEPLLLLGDSSGYLMSYVDGQSLRKVLGARILRSPKRTLVGQRLIDGLRTFHLATRMPYYDFHPDNVMIDNDFGVVLLDPTLPSLVGQEIAKSSRLGFMSADLGYWLHVVATMGAQGGIVQRNWWRLLQLTFQLIQIATNEGDVDIRTLSSDAFGTAAKHAKSLIAGRDPRDLAVGLITLAVLGGMHFLSRGWLKDSN